MADWTRSCENRVLPRPCHGGRHWGAVQRSLQGVEGATFEEGLTFEDLGGPMVYCINGTIDNMAANEAECFEQLRMFLSYLPNPGKEPPLVIPCVDSEMGEDMTLHNITPSRQLRISS